MLKAIDVKIAKQKGYLNYRIITDIGSGLNYKRKGFNELLKKRKRFTNNCSKF